MPAENAKKAAEPKISAVTAKDAKQNTFVPADKRTQPKASAVEPAKKEK